ncbi:retrovirus-related pol polyprotein from transposon TNT 1-94, partial [Tanacetum coccineum]
ATRDTNPGRLVARDRLKRKARRGFFPGRDTPATLPGSHSFSQTMKCHAGIGFVIPKDMVAVELPDGNIAMAKKEGDVCFDNGFVLRNVLYVPGLTCNLLSVPQLLDEGNCIVQFAPNICVIQDLTSRTVIGAGERRDGGLFYFREMPPTRAFKTTTTLPFDLWHKRLGHPSLEVLKLLPQVNLNKKDKELSQSCDVCHRAKQSREKFPVSDNKVASIFELIHCDLWGPYKTTSSCGASYFLTIVDDFSRSVWVYLLVHKSEVFESMKMFLAMVKRQFNKHVKIVRSDNGTEFTCMKQFFLDEGIIFQTSCVGTPQQNGRVERKHRHILNVARALRFQSSLPIDFWGECILTAAYLINRTPSPILKGKTPYTVLHNVEPPYNHLRTFGCLCYAHTKTGDKFASRSRKCVFVGYPYGQKGWRLFDFEKLEFFMSRDVDFLEHIFLYDTEPIVPSVNDNEYNDTGLHEEPPSQDRVNVKEQIQEENLGRGHRTPFPIAHYVNCDKFSYCHQTFLEAIEKEMHYEAIKDKSWRSAMDSELEALEQNNT